MSEEISVSMNAAAVNAPAVEITVASQPAAKTRTAAWLRSTGIVLAGSALVAVCAHLALPLYFTPVPLSLAPFAVLVLGLLLRPGLAAATLVAYLAEGALGLPVFSPTPALPGLAHLIGPTGGYLLSYPLAAALIAFMVSRFGRSFVPAALASALGSFVILASGALWLAALSHTSIASAFTLGVLPFLPGDALKVAAAAGIAAGFTRLRRAN